MEAETNLPGGETVSAPVGEDPVRERENLLLAATVQELREHAERLHQATAELRAQNERLAETQNALAAERSRYRELFELAPEACLLTDSSGVIVEANDGAVELLRVEARSLVGQPLTAFVEDAARRPFRRELNELAATTGRRRSELRIAPREGPVLDVDATVTSLAERDDGGALLWLLRDVSERVGTTRRLGEQLDERTHELEATRERLERERVYLRDLFQRLQDGVVAIDAELNVVFANQVAKHLFLPADLAEGRPLPQPWPDEVGALVRSLFTPRPIMRELHAEIDEGQVLAIRGIPALGAETAGLVINDISMRWRRDRVEREFVANAAHELRTPLTAISGAIEVLQGGAKHDPLQRDRFLGHIERECARLGRLTSALLVLARTQMGVESPRLELIELRPLLEQAAADVRPASGVRVEVRCPRGVGAFANRALVEQALGNLAANAAKHTDRGTISLRCVSGESGWVALEVHDTGPGMRPEEQQRATERFFRAGGEPGFGLGLAIASEAAHALGGRLELNSRPGHGTTARILLPSAQVVSNE